MRVKTFMDLPIIYGDDQWMLHEEQGHARVTKTKEAFEAAAARRGGRVQELLR